MSQDCRIANVMKKGKKRKWGRNLDEEEFYNKRLVLLGGGPNPSLFLSPGQWQARKAGNWDATRQWAMTTDPPKLGQK